MANTRTPILTGTEVCLTDLGGQNVAVKNLSDGSVWASAFPSITAGADNVIEIPAGGGEVVLDARGTVYLLGTGKVQCTGTNYATPNFRQPSASGGGGGGTSDVTKAYVDAQDSNTLGLATAYTDTAVNDVKSDVTTNAANIAELQSGLTASNSAIAANATAVTAAQTAANTANAAATAAQTAADTAQTTANAAKSTADAAQTAINTLNGTGVGSVQKAVSDGIAEVIAGAPESLDTLKEISDWISSHSDSAAAMNTQIQENSNDITALEGGKADKTEIPTTLPANGGNAATVNGHTVKSDVPEKAKFTDTTYSNVAGSTDSASGKAGLVPAPMAGIQNNEYLKATGTWANPFIPLRITEANPDLNNYLTPGMYYFDSNHTPANIPAGSNGWLFVFGEQTMKQIWFRFGSETNTFQTFIRTISENVVYKWHRFVTEEV